MEKAKVVSRDPPGLLHVWTEEAGKGKIEAEREEKF